MFWHVIYYQKKKKKTIEKKKTIDCEKEIPFAVSFYQSKTIKLEEKKIPLVAIERIKQIQYLSIYIVSNIQTPIIDTNRNKQLKL